MDLPWVEKSRVNQRSYKGTRTWTIMGFAQKSEDSRVPGITAIGAVKVGCDWVKSIKWQTKDLRLYLVAVQGQTRRVL